MQKIIININNLIRIIINMINKIIGKIIEKLKDNIITDINREITLVIKEIILIKATKILHLNQINNLIKVIIITIIIKMKEKQRT